MRFVALAALVAVGVAACGGRGDHGGRVGADGGVAWAARGAPSDAELETALRTSDATLFERLGPHRYRGHTKMEVTFPGAPPEVLEEQFLLEASSGGQLHGLRDNSRDQGVEFYLLGGELYIRPRYGTFVRRRPEEGEVERLRASVFGSLGATAELLGRFVTSRPLGRAQAGGREVARVALTPAASPRPARPESEPGRKWRESVALRALTGTVALDTRSSAPLSVELKASYTFTRGDRAGAVALELEGTVEPGVDTKLAAPESVGAPQRTRYHSERQQLLEGLAPPHGGP